MTLHLQSTIFGQFVRMISRNGKFKYPDEIDPFLWKTAFQQDHSQELDPSQQSRERQHTGGPVDGSGVGKNSHGASSEDVEKKRRSIPPTSNFSDVVVVGWYGSDDPEASHLAASNMTGNLVHATNSLEYCTESPELAYQIETFHRFPDVYSQLRRVHRKLHLRTWGGGFDG